MAVQATPPVASFSLFTASKQVQFLETLKRIRFSGQLVLTGPEGQQWIFFLYLGRLMYATGGNHPVRRWQRNLAAYCPQIASDRSIMQRDLADFDPASCKTCWQYHLLSAWVAQQKITYEQTAKLIQGVVIEILFDVAQAMRATYQIKQDSSLSTQLVLLDVHQTIAEVDQLWQVWHNDRVASYSPNMAPVIKQPDQLRERTSAPVYQILSKLLDGKHTLRDLGVQMKRDVLQVTRSLLPYIEGGLVELASIPDLPIPLRGNVPETPPTAVEPKEQALIACVDDSPLVCHTMEKLLTAAGYRFVGIEDGLRAIAILLARKPDLIFLDLVMPTTNGYEICAQLRKLFFFRDTPIVILTGNDGIVDRVKAKLVGASDFLSKPIDAGIVLGVIQKYLKCH
ncbi:MAG TPA: response regulator [Cyanobacteria bacterium UBA8803]|nr:response regulator [Cyanobacteria bacterium UBA9273]HBL58480.1 response regulator [Cyanobacteria bacterium UBA8803]